MTANLGCHNMMALMITMIFKNEHECYADNNTHKYIINIYDEIQCCVYRLSPPPYTDIRLKVDLLK